MHRLVLPAALSLALAACGQNTAPVDGTDAAVSSSETVAADGADSRSATVDTALQAAIDGDWRSADNKARDRFRHPAETLAFFGIRPDMQVVEITPGGGWYTEILAPYLRDAGQWTGAIVDPSVLPSERARDYYARSNQGLRDKLAAAPQQFERGALVEYDPAAPSLGEPDSADAVVTFRNVHNWIGDGSAEHMFAAFHAVLKPGGVLGLVEHRADQDVPEGDRSGYVSEAQVIAMAEKAGFVLEEKSEINANPADTKDHPNGVWTLPPVNRHDAADADKYAAIGESDRMTLRFRKPAQ